MKTNEKGVYCIRSLGMQDVSKQANFGGIIDSVSVLGYDGPVQYERTKEGLKHASKIYLSPLPQESKNHGYFFHP